jgi:hypothetical protein
VSDDRWVIGNATHDPWPLNHEPYTQAQAERAVNWQFRGSPAERPDYWRIVTTDELREILSTMKRGPYTEEAWTRFTSQFFLSIDEAGEILAAAVDDWNNDQAQAEGWAIFNLGDDLGTSIDRDDETAVFEGDEAAVAFVRAQDTDYHRRALKIHHAADSMRFHLWGLEWVHSRIGPDTE